VRSGVIRVLVAHAFAHAATTKLQYVMAFISSTNEIAMKGAQNLGIQLLTTLPLSPKASTPPLNYLTYVVPKNP
jgi:hypothetical protein